MTRKTGLLFIIAVISLVSGYLMSKASLVGKAGMSLFYQEYNFLKSWWKGGLLIFAILMVLYLLHALVQRKYPENKARVIHTGACILSIIGLYFTYNDFRHTLSHRLLGERFHLGVYLFWIGWIIIGVFYSVNARTNNTIKSHHDDVIKT
jgi:uncharacterized membrane protein